MKLSKLVKDKNITWFSKILFYEILHNSLDFGYFNYSTSFLSNAFDVSERTILNSLKELEENGYIKRETTMYDGKNEVKERKIFILGTEENFLTWCKIFPKVVQKIAGGTENNFIEVLKIFSEGSAESFQTWCRKLHINTNTNNTISSSLVNKPTLEEVCKVVNEKGINNNLAERFFNYYENLEWKTKNGNPITDWKSSVISWCTEEEKKKNPYTELKDRTPPKDNLWNHTLEEIQQIASLPNAKEIFIKDFKYKTWNELKFDLDNFSHKHFIDCKKIYEPTN